MRKSFWYVYIAALFVLALLTACSKSVDQEIPKLSFDEFEPLLKKDNDTVYVINFWATWCKPCIKELPDFEKLNRNYADQKVKVVLVSLDFPNKHDELLIPFVEENNLKSEIVHLIDVDANSWIDKVSPLWSGSIPATVIYRGSSSEFHESMLSYDQLTQIVESKM
jgi:thiol-disulfide isomerase/thioredoxin